MRIFTRMALAIVLGVAGAGAHAVTSEQLKHLKPWPEDANIYGWQIMTGFEHDYYRDRMARAQSEQEREQIRTAHRWQMDQRAKQMGVVLPEPEAVHKHARHHRHGHRHS